MSARPEITNIAIFCDFENVALGVSESKYSKFDIGAVLDRLLLKGSIVVKKAYCDWERYKSHKGAMHEAAFEMIEIPHVRMSGKNSADIRLVVDALDFCHTKPHVDTFVIISGDSDFSPLVSKLRENAKTVIGVGVKNSTSDLLIANCDEFIFYDDLEREKRKARKTAAAREAKEAKAPAKEAAAAKDAAAPVPAKAAKARAAKAGSPRGRARGDAQASVETLAEPGVAPAPENGAGADEARGDPEHRRQAGIAIVVDTLEALSSERGAERIFGSMIKQAIKRVRPQFSESFHGFRSFNAMLEAAQAAGAVELDRDEKSGGYVVRLKAAEL